jgi:hypothetical protein
MLYKLVTSLFMHMYCCIEMAMYKIILHKAEYHEENGKNFPGKIVVDIPKYKKRAYIFKKKNKQNKVDPPKGLETGNHPYSRNYIK